MKKSKLDMLSNIIQSSADIVLGDFNSDFLAFQNPSPKKLEFIKGLGCSDEDAKQWHSAPYELLSSKGYDNVKFDNPTSKFGTQPDGIWFSKQLQYKSKEVLDALTSEASDHNGLMATFKIGS